MRKIQLVGIAGILSAVAGCATSASTAGLATPWAVAGIHTFKPQPNGAEPNPAQVDRQVAKLLDDASKASSSDADVRVAAR